MTHYEQMRLQAKVANLEAGWSSCSQACARMQGERDVALKELNRLTRGDVSNIITTLGDALTRLGELERRLPIVLTPAEIQSNYNRLQWAEDLLRQLPQTHEGRNSWILNYGTLQAGA